MNNTDTFLTGKKNEAPLSKTDSCESSNARCPFERACVLSKVYVAFLICMVLSEESAVMKGFDIERSWGGRRRKVHTGAQNRVAGVMAEAGSLHCLIP